MYKTDSLDLKNTCPSSGRATSSHILENCKVTEMTALKSHHMRKTINLFPVDIDKREQGCAAP
jgi:hypothetical protein